MSLSQTLRHFAAVLRQQGPRVAATAFLDRLAEWHYERYFGIATRAIVSRAALGYADPTWKEYVPTSYRGLFAMLRRFAPGPAGTFVDYGCGQGRALAVAATFPFARVIGVELHPGLVAQGRANLARARRRFACPQVEIAHLGADAFVVPDDATVAFFFNPFSGPVLLRTLAQLRASLARRPRPLRLICAVPPQSGFAATLRDVADLALVARRRWSPELEYLILEFRAPATRSSGAAATARAANS